MAKDTTGRLHVTVKSGGKRKLSSKLWLERQLNDPYVAQAKKDGYRSRAAYKLIEIDDKYRFLKSGQAVVDLGAAPGGWSQIAAKRIGATNGKGKVVAIDLLEMPEIAGVAFAQLDFLANDAPEKLLAMMGGRADVVMSDMAANTTGHRKTDQLRIVGLVEIAAAFASEILNPGGAFLAKVFQSGADADLLAQLKREFASVRHEHFARLHCDGVSRPFLAVEGRNLSIDVANTEKVKDNLSCIRGDVKNLNTPSQHDHQAVARFPSPVYRLSLCILPDVAPCYKGIQGRIRKSPEESMAPQ